MRRRILGLLCALALCLGLTPTTALAAGEHSSHSDGWTELTAGTTTLSGGSYYLSGDVEYTGAESITVSGEVTLCLNGHELDLNGQHISVDSGASLTLCDCSTGGILTGGSGSNGGGVYVDGGGTFTMTGGNITGNTANAGGGVYVYKGGTFTMEGGSISSNNTTSGGGGGVMVYEGTFTLSGGSITGNATNDETYGYGGGVCLYGTFNLSGDVIIQNNTKAGATDNLYLAWNTISIIGPLDENAHIGVTAEGVPRNFISGWSDNMARENPADYFSSDGDALGIGLNADGNVVLGSLCTTITLNPNGGTLPDFSLVEGAALPIPYKTGYTFDGWYENPELTGNPVTDVPTGNTVSLTFYAKWTVNTYTISADVTPQNAGSVTVNGGTSATVEVGTEVALSATANSGYRFVGWTSSNVDVAFADSSSANTTFTMPEGDVTVTAGFVRVYTVTVGQTTGGAVAADKDTASEGETVTLTATPGSNYRFAGWASSNGGAFADASSASTTFTMPANDVTITASWRYDPPYVPPAKTPSQQALEKIKTADDGDTVTVSLPTGDTVLDAEVFEALAGRDVTLVVKLPGGAAWTVDGKGIPENADLADIDMGVTTGAGTIPADVVNAVTGEAGTVQLALAHNGPFGFEMTLTAPVGAESAGLWANLYRYDEAAGRLVFQTSAKVGEDGTAALPFDHASQWAIVLDTVSHELPFSDVSPADWFANPVGVAYRSGLMVGYSDGSGLFGPNDELTRAQAAAVLFRALGTDAKAPACGMADVDPGAWYAGPVDWAVSSGLMVGYDDGSGRFGVDDALTREQLAVVLWRAAGSPDAGAYDDTLFSDGDDASKWAESALAWAVKTGVLKGSDDGSGGTELRPTAPVTRAEAATMLARKLGAK